MTEDTYPKLMLQVADAYKMSRDDFKIILDEMMDKDERRSFHRPIQFEEEDKKNRKDKKK